MSIFRLF